MENSSVVEQFHIALNDSSYEMMKHQRDVLQKQLDEARRHIATFPGKLVEARINAKLGLPQVKYDYTTHGRIMITRL